MTANEPAFQGRPNNENADWNDSRKKLQYLKNPRSPRFIEMLVKRRSFLLLAIEESSIAGATKKSITVLRKINNRKRQSHQP